MSVFRIALCLLLLPALCPWQAETCCGEELEISFSQAQLDPIVELFLPPPGSPDRIHFTREGMLIQQGEDVLGRPTGVAGFKTLLLAGGDFTVTFDFRCPRLEPPLEGWGQGIVLAVFLDDESQTILKMARLACPGRDPFCQVEINHRTGNITPIYRPHTMDFEIGSFVISRVGDKVSFTVDNGAEQRLLEEFPCPPNDVRSVELGCTRLDKGNTPAEYLLERLHIQADRFFAYQTPKQPWFNWWKVLVGAQVILVIGLLWELARRRNQ